MPASLPAVFKPSPVTLILPVTKSVDNAGRELRRHARADGNGCWGYFPSLAGRPGIHADLPACRGFAAALPEVADGGQNYRFNFIRLSLGSQSRRPAYHLDSDAATALTGDLATLDQREVGRILLNLSTEEERNLHYLDLDVSALPLAHEGSYVRAADDVAATRYTRRAVIPPRSGAIVHGIRFVANRVLHSGVDGPCGHFVAAYGYDRRGPWR
jgi:hypothetical protein